MPGRRPKWLYPTPIEKLCDVLGRPYFLWDVEMSLETFRERLHDEDPAVRAYFTGKLMRQAKPDDVFHFLDVDELLERWNAVQPYLGNSRPMWTFLVDRWTAADAA